MFFIRTNDGKVIGKQTRNDKGELIHIPRLYASERNARSAIALRGLRQAAIVSAGVRANRRVINATVTPRRTVRDSFGQFI